MQGCSMNHLHRSHSVLHTGCSVLFPQRMSLSFCPNWAPPSEGLPWMGRPLLSSDPPRVCGSHSTSFPVPFPSSFFCPTWLSRSLSCPFRCPRSSTSIQQVLCENSICRCILDVFVGVGGFHILILLPNLSFVKSVFTASIRIRINLR